MGEFRMPSLGADMDEGTLLEWLVAPGDAVRRGDIVAVVDTEKSDIEVEVFESGVVRELLVPEGTKVPVGTPLALIETGAAASAVPAPAPPAAAPPPQPPATPVLVVAGPPRGVPTTQRTAGRVLSPVVRHLAEELHVDVGDVAGTGAGGVVTRHDVEVAAATPAAVAPAVAGVRASPYARRLAAERGVDLATVAGTGPGGAVVAGDVPLRPVRTEAAPPAPDRGATMRDVIARSMARSKREIPHYYLQTTVDLSAALAWLRARNEARPVTERLLPAAL
ncbi:MAG TPA: E3 binding domain-containing protein, partial [Acidimicrobiales bacterium]|nr:E3 binding domain-containing protein [Acidimicrobiales bacterium]